MVSLVRRAGRSQPTRVRDKERQRIRRQTRSDSRGAEADEQHQRDLERNRERQRRYRERLRVRVRNHERSASEDPVVPVDNRVDRDSPMHDISEREFPEEASDENVEDATDTERSAYVPVHQQWAIHDFLDHLALIRDDLHECATCLERYHGMKMHGTQCARCNNEVRLMYSLSG